jgi:hypothetical protein
MERELNYLKLVFFMKNGYLTPALSMKNVCLTPALSMKDGEGVDLP